MSLAVLVGLLCLQPRTLEFWGSHPQPHGLDCSQHPATISARTVFWLAFGRQGYQIRRLPSHPTPRWNHPFCWSFLFYGCKIRRKLRTIATAKRAFSFRRAYVWHSINDKWHLPPSHGDQRNIHVPQSSTAPQAADVLSLAILPVIFGWLLSASPTWAQPDVCSTSVISL